MTPLDFIQNCPPFDRLDKVDLELVSRSLEVVRYPSESHILAQGGPVNQYLYLIHQGIVRLERNGETVQLLEEGELFGFVSLFSQKPPVFEVITEEEAEIYQLPGEVARYLGEQPAFAEFFLKGLTERLQRASHLSQTSPLTGDMAVPVQYLITRPPVFIESGATVAEAAGVMRSQKVSSVLVKGPQPGIITDRDLRNRVLAEGLGPATPVQQVMSQPLKTLPVETPAYSALLFMLEENIHHLPLTQQGQMVGLVTDTDLLRHQVKSPLYLLKRVQKLADSSSLSRYAVEIAGTVKSLFEAGLDIGHIGRIISNLNDALISRLLKLAEAEFGPPPTPYAWIVFGSEGRQEQTLLTDQDNALIYLEADEESHLYFSKLAQRVVEDLLQAGFPACLGGYMATHWRRPLRDWEVLFRDWTQTPEPQALLEASIFFDFRAVAGSLALDSLEAILLKARERPLFLAQLARNSLNFQPPLGFFRRIREEEGGVDLKKGGITPIVALARLYALEAGLPARSTLDRLDALSQNGDLGQEKAELLAEAFRFVQHLRLREQLHLVQIRQAPGNKARLEALSPLERRHLKEAFLVIREVQAMTAARFQTGRLG
jgi:CBS domain-containing protein